MRVQYTAAEPLGGIHIRDALERQHDLSPRDKRAADGAGRIGIALPEIHAVEAGENRRAVAPRLRLDGAADAVRRDDLAAGEVSVFHNVSFLRFARK